MKRIVLEWSLIVSIGMTLALSTLWFVSRFFEPSTYHLRFSTSPRSQDDLHLLVGNGDLTLCDQFEAGSSGNIRPLIVAPGRLCPPDIHRGDRMGHVTIPGLDLQYYRVATDGYLIWSLRLSLLIPSVLFFLLAVLCRRRLKRLRRQVEQSSVVMWNQVRRVRATHQFNNHHPTGAFHPIVVLRN